MLHGIKVNNSPWTCDGFFLGKDKKLISKKLQVFGLNQHRRRDCVLFCPKESSFGLKLKVVVHNGSSIKSYPKHAAYIDFTKLLRLRFLGKG